MPSDARISSPNLPLAKSIGTGQVPTSFTATAYKPTTTKPTTGNEVLVAYDQTSALNNSTILDCSLLNIIPFSSVNSATSVGIRVVGWRYYGSVWIPVVLYDGTLAYTSGTVPSVSIDTVTQYFFSGFTTSGWGPAPSTYSPATAAAANDGVAAITVDPVGCTLVTVHFKASAGTMGFLWNTI